MTVPAPGVNSNDLLLGVPLGAEHDFNSERGSDAGEAQGGTNDRGRERYGAARQPSSKLTRSRSGVRVPTCLPFHSPILRGRAARCRRLPAPAAGANGRPDFPCAPDGDKIAAMSGQPPNSAIVPLPGGARSFDLGGTWLKVHGDWLRTARLATTAATVPPGPPVGMDIWRSSAGCPGCGLLWQNTGSVVDGLWCGTLAVGSAGLGDVLGGAAAAAQWAQTATLSAAAAEPWVAGAASAGRDFLLGWSGPPPSPGPASWGR